MAEALIFLADEVPTRVDKKDGDWEQVYFTVPVGQFEHQLPNQYRRFVAKGLTSIRVMVTHADEYGNIRLVNLQAARAYKPDLLITCHPGESRRVNAEFNIEGFSAQIVWLWQVKVNGERSRVVRIQF